MKEKTNTIEIRESLFIFGSEGREFVLEGETSEEIRKSPKSLKSNNSQYDP